MTDANRHRKILRAWYSVLSAYPEALTPFCVSETAKRARCSRSEVLAALGTE